MNKIILDLIAHPTQDERKIIIVDKKKVNKKELILNKLKKYTNSEGLVDMAKFRIESPKEYNLLYHYFGSIDKAIEEAGLMKVSLSSKKNTMSVKNQLAYDMFKYFFRHKTNISTIRNKFKCSDSDIENLFKSLYTASDNKNEKELEYFTLDTNDKKKINNNLRDAMAGEYLLRLREVSKLTMDAIGKKYGCSRSAVEQFIRTEEKRRNG